MQGQLEREEEVQSDAKRGKSEREDIQTSRSRQSWTFSAPEKGMIPFPLSIQSNFEQF